MVHLGVHKGSCGEIQFYPYNRMKPHIIVLLALKVSMAIQLVLILARVQTEDHLAYLISDTLFKTFLGLFLIMYFYFTRIYWREI